MLVMSRLSKLKKLLLLPSIALPLIFPLSLQASTSVMSGQALHISCNGSIQDDSGAKNTVINQGVILGTDRFENEKSACHFNGNSYLQISKGFMNSASFTISTWVKPNGYSTEIDTAIVSNYAGNNSGLQHFGLRLTRAGRAGMFYNDGSGFRGFQSPSQITGGNWHHVVGVFSSGNEAKIYVDGVLQNSRSSVPVEITPSQDLFIGRGGISELASGRFNGMIDDIRIYDRALSLAEVETLSAMIIAENGETFIPIGIGELDPFISISPSGDNSPDLLVTPNTNGSVSINILSTSGGVDRNIRSGESDLSSVTMILNPDGSYDAIDEEFPGMVASIDNNGDISVVDSAHPDMKTTLVAGSQGYTVSDAEFPSINSFINPNGTITMIDADEPDLSVTYDSKDSSFTVFDSETGLETHVDRDGNASIINNENPNEAMVFNIFDEEENLIIVDLVNNVCTLVLVDNDVRELRFKKLFKKVKNVVKKVVKVVKKVVSVAKKVVSFVKKSAKFISKIAKAWKVIAPKIACFWKCLPLIGKVGIVAGGVGLVAIGAIIVAKKVRDYLRSRTVREEVVVYEEDQVLSNTEVANDDANALEDQIEDDAPGTRSRKLRTSVSQSQCDEIQISHIDILPPATAISNPSKHSIILNWQTDEEVNISGFNVLRAFNKDSDGNLIDPVKINTSLIPSKSLDLEGTQYDYADSNVSENVRYFYVIESIDVEGNSVIHHAYVAEGMLTPKEKPLMVDPVSFNVGFTDNQTQFQWSTLFEKDTAGFVVWQAKPANADCTDHTNYSNVKRLNNNTIPARGVGTSALYMYEVAGAIQEYCYGLEEKLLNGTSNFYIMGPGINGVMSSGN
jgi:hypothetical protein